MVTEIKVHFVHLRCSLHHQLVVNQASNIMAHLTLTHSLTRSFSALAHTHTQYAVEQLLEHIRTLEAYEMPKLILKGYFSNVIIELDVPFLLPGFYGHFSLLLLHILYLFVCRHRWRLLLVFTRPFRFCSKCQGPKFNVCAPPHSLFVANTPKGNDIEWETNGHGSFWCASAKGSDDIVFVYSIDEARAINLFRILRRAERKVWSWVRAIHTSARRYHGHPNIRIWICVTVAWT